ncbi:MAG TPA: ATP-binding protein [Methanomassiliicoccales archaeon]|jgi:signal transduction histidine kinase
MESNREIPAHENEEGTQGRSELELHRIEWMLTKAFDESDSKVVADGSAGLGAKEERNSHLIADAVGKDVLEGIILDTLNLLGTSAAVYEKDGTCSMGIFSSGWCRYLDNACRNEDEGNDMEEGGLLCHHRNWSESTKLAEEANGPVDRPCPGGLHIYAVPIKAGGDVIGSINIGYGDPPQDRQVLLQIADQKHLDGEQLIKAAHAYRSRPLFMVESAKSRIRTSAQLIGVIVEKHYAEAELEMRAKELSRSNKELEQFAYVASHDLKEPLRMVSSYLSLLEKRYKDRLDEEANEYIGFAVDGAQRMNDLVDGLLTYSRIDRSTTPFEQVDLEEVFQIATTNLEVSIRDSGTVLSHDVLPQVLGDRRQLIQLFQNLMSNALKFQNGNVPQVQVSSQAEGKDWRISIKDNGIGISPEHSERIFQMFRRLHTRDEYPGNGMGLAISKKIVERHGGRIWFESEPNKGTTFIFTIPVSVRT